MLSLLPMSETMMYILFSLREPRHGYGIMLYVKELTAGRIKLGAGTLYQTLAKLLKTGLIGVIKVEDRKKFYLSTPKGNEALKSEVTRIKSIYLDMEDIL